MEQQKFPSWLAIGVILIFTGYITVMFEVIFIRYLIQESIASGVILAIIYNILALLTYRSYYMVINTSPVFHGAELNDQYANEMNEILAYTKKSNAIIQTRRLRKHRYLFDTSQIKQQQLAYADDITDLFDQQQGNNQNMHIVNNDHNSEKEGDKHKVYVNEPNDDFEGKRQQVALEEQNKEITIGTNNGQQDPQIFTEEDYQKLQFQLLFTEFNQFNTIKFSDVAYDVAQIKYCFKCQAIKYPRVHHCKQCNKCISRMDHHCPWVANCVGKANHKFFNLFLLYGGLCGLIVSLSVFIEYMFYDQVLVKQMSEFEHSHTTVIGSSSCPAFIVALGMFIFQVVIACRNCTTLESNIDEMNTGKYKNLLKNPFRKSTRIENMNEVFGDRILYWFIPIHNNPLKQKSEGFIQLVRD